MKVHEETVERPGLGRVTMDSTNWRVGFGMQRIPAYQEEKCAKIMKTYFSEKET